MLSLTILSENRGGYENFNQTCFNAHAVLKHLEHDLIHRATLITFMNKINYLEFTMKKKKEKKEKKLWRFLKDVWKHIKR